MVNNFRANGTHLYFGFHDKSVLLIGLGRTVQQSLNHVTAIFRVNGTIIYLRFNDASVLLIGMGRTVQ